MKNLFLMLAINKLETFNKVCYVTILFICIACLMSCDNNPKNKETENSEISLQERINQLEEENEKLKSQKVEKESADTFTTFKGKTYITSKVVMQFYNDGYSWGVAHKDARYNSYSELKSDAEKQFDMTWTYAFGRPSDEQLKKIYNECNESYMKGWKEGMGKRAELNEY